jgi:hypothetical protein
MGNEEALLQVIERSRHELQKAQDAADANPRPANVCTAHDSQFALTKAGTNAMDTMLMIAQQIIRGGFSEHAPVGLIGSAFALLNRPWPWIFASIAVFSPNIVSILTTVQGMFHK